MIIKESKLDAVLKKAYKGAGIHVERKEDKLIMTTAYLYIEASLKEATNEFKALIVKYLGRLPEDGFTGTISEDKDQKAIPGTINLDMYEKDMSMCMCVKPTFFQYKDEQVIQMADGNVCTVPEKEWAVFDENQMKDTEEILCNWKKDNRMIAIKTDSMVLGFIYKNPDETLENLNGVGLL